MVKSSRVLFSRKAEVVASGKWQEGRRMQEVDSIYLVDTSSTMVLGDVHTGRK